MDRRLAPAPSAQRLARMLGGWTSTHGSLPRRLATALRQLIELGELASDTRLPSERALADALVVSRSTVVGAYDVLHGQGLVLSRPASGHWIAHRERRHDADMRPVTFPWPHRLVPPDSALGHPTTTIDLSAIAMTASPILADVLDRLSDGGWTTVTDEWAYLPLGWPPLRQAVAAECSRRGLPTTYREVLVTSGAQQGLSLVVDALVRAGDVVAVEDPAYPGLFPVLRHAGARLRSIPSGADGIDTGLLEETVRVDNPRLAVITPAHHNPTGVVLGSESRTRVAGVAGQRELVVVELYASADLSLDNDPAPPPLGVLGNADSMVVVGSLSTLAWSGLRIGWIRAPEHLIGLFGKRKAVTDLGTPLLSQLVATQLMARHDELRRLRNHELAERCRLTIDLLDELMPDFDVPRPAGGGCLWFAMPSGRADDFVQVALRHGVAVLPGSLCSAGGAHQDSLRLAFSGDPTALLIGVERLAAAWQEYRRHVR